VALELAERGFSVRATMRRPEASEPLSHPSGRLHTARLDVTDPDSIEIPDDLSVLVNNAGVEQAYLPVEATPLDAWREVFETNLFGAVEVTRRALPVLRANGGGVVCNVTSAALVMGVPFYAVYRASKAALQALGESLRAEVAPFGIRVVEILPGPVATDMLAGSGRVPEAAADPGYGAMAQSLYEGRMAVERQAVTPAQAARAVVDAIVDDGGPLRWPCDPLGAQLLEAWRGDPDTTSGAGPL
jgi:NAD(P)-dependent dehydrogenase (short-subunit alcohol dehydrogenase family)